MHRALKRLFLTRRKDRVTTQRRQTFSRRCVRKLGSPPQPASHLRPSHSTSPATCLSRTLEDLGPAYVNQWQHQVWLSGDYHDRTSTGKLIQTSQDISTPSYS